MDTVPLSHTRVLNIRNGFGHFHITWYSASNDVQGDPSYFLKLSGEASFRSLFSSLMYVTRTILVFFLVALILRERSHQALGIVRHALGQHYIANEPSWSLVARGQAEDNWTSSEGIYFSHSRPLGLDLYEQRFCFGRPFTQPFFPRGEETVVCGSSLPSDLVTPPYFKGTVVTQPSSLGGLH